MPSTSPNVEPLEQFERVLRSACGELGRRIRAGESCSAEEYLTRHPELTTTADLAIELIYTEYVVRTELEQSVSQDELLSRFPQWRTDLEQLMEVHRQVCGEPAAESTVVRERQKLLGTQADAVIGNAEVVRADRRVGNYELVEEIGRGGMGVIYRARQAGLNRHVALKMMLSGDFASPRERMRFQQEVESTARLHHPNIVPIYEVGTHDGQPYYSMELVAGARLDEILERRPLPPRVAAELLVRLARAVHYAHQRGVVHRDLKPSNVLLAPSDRENGFALGTHDGDTAFCDPKIADFGLAKNLVDGQALHTLSGSVIGTPNYMSPEQARGKEVGPTSDVYSLGAILYESLTGQPPFRGSSPMETLRQVIGNEPIAPLRLQPKLPRDVAIICLKCLEKSPGSRYANALELADDLRRFLDGEPIRAKAVSLSEWLVKWARRYPAIASLGVTLLVVLLIGFSTVFALWRKAEFRRTFAESEQLKSEVARQVAEDARAAADKARSASERSLYFHRVAQAHAECDAHQIGRANRLLDECPESMRDWEWSYLKTLCHDQLLTLRGHTNQIACVAYSRDGKLVASGSGQWASGRSGEVIVWDAATGEIRNVLRGQSGQIAHVTFTPDSQHIAACSMRWDNPQPASLKVWNVSGDELISLSINAWDVEFSPDGTRFVTGGIDGYIRVWNAHDGTPARRMAGHSKSPNPNVFDVAFSPDGKRIASAGRDGFCRVYDSETGEELFTQLTDGDCRRVSFSPDGRYLAFTNYGDALYIQDLTVASAKPVLHRIYNGRIIEFTFSPEGRRLGVAGVDGSVRIISFGTAEPAMAEQKRIRVHDGVVMALAFSPDGRALATGGIDHTVKISDVQADFQPQEIHYRGAGSFHRLTFSPNSEKLFLPSGYNTGWPGSGARVLAVFNVIKTATDKPLRGHTGWLTDVAVSSDGSRLATSSADKSVRIWDSASDAELRMLVGHTAEVTSVAFLSGNRRVATASADGTVRIWNVEKGDSIRELRGHEGKVTTVRYNGTWLASAGADGTVRFWNVESDHHGPVLRGNTGRINSLAFSHDSERLATAGEDGTARIWDVATGDQIHVLRGHGAAVNEVAFSVSDQRLASSSHDWSVKLWDVESGEQALTLRGNNVAAGLAFSPDGKQLVAARGAHLRFWHSEPQPPSPRSSLAFDNANRVWHEREAKQCETDKQFLAAAFHLSGLIQQQPTVAKHYRRRGNALAEIGDWKRASADFAKILELSPGNGSVVLAAHAKLAQGQVDDFDRLSRQLLDSLTDSTPPGTANDYVWYRLLLPIENTEAVRLVELSQRALSNATNDAERLAHTNTYAAALFRAGRYDEARTWLQKSIELDGADGSIEDWLLLALTEHRLGRAVEARQWLDKSTTWLANPPDKNLSKLPVPTFWTFRVARNALRREAKTVIDKPIKQSDE